MMTTVMGDRDGNIEQMPGKENNEDDPSYHAHRPPNTDGSVFSTRYAAHLSLLPIPKFGKTDVRDLVGWN